MSAISCKSTAQKAAHHPQRHSVTTSRMRPTTVTATWFLFLSSFTSEQHTKGISGTVLLLCMWRHTEIQVADPTCYISKSQNSETRPTSPSTDAVQPGMWQGSHQSTSSSSAFPAISLKFIILCEIFVYVTDFIQTIEVVTFCLHRWCMLGVFLLLAFTSLGHECPCDGMHVCTD